MLQWLGPRLSTEMPDTHSLPVETPRIYTGKAMLTSDTVQAVLLVLCAAMMNAAYALPMKLNRKWDWEHSWFAFSVLGVAVVPTGIALLTVPALWSTYGAVSGGTLAKMVLFGASWGVSLAFF